MNEKERPFAGEKTTFDGDGRDLAELGELSERAQIMPRQPGSGAGTSTQGSIHEQGTDCGVARALNEVVLSGCSPIPLAAYLKALGILRLIGEQADPDARGYWRDEKFILATRLDAVALQDFFFEEYAPTPVLAPWNGGSGFYFREEKLQTVDPATGKRIKTGRRTEPTQATRTLENLLSSTSTRFAIYRETTFVSKKVLEHLDVNEAPKGDEKDKLLVRLRAEIPDPALQCMDAALLLTGEKTYYPPLLGTGGTDGNLDFTNNFVQRLLSILDRDTGRPLPGATDTLKASLFGEAHPGLPSAAVGQFAPGAAGGPNQTAGFEAKALVNPWDFILMLEGALLFAAAATRRLEGSAPGTLSYPFTVRATGAGAGSTALSDEEQARHEMWMPLWEAPSTLEEIRALLAEGRITLGRRPPRDGLDVVRAVSRLGVDRGIAAFQRYAFLQRSGKSYFATPLNRIEVRRNPAADIISELDTGNWLRDFRRLGRANGSARVQSLVRRLEDALFALTSAPTGHVAPAVQRVLILLGEIQRYLATSPAARKACPPVPALSEQWIALAEDGSTEFSLAAALASLYARGGDKPGEPLRRTMLMRSHLAPERYERGRFMWDDSVRHQVIWGAGTLENNLIDVLRRRLIEFERAELADKPFESTRAAPLANVAAWLGGELDSRRLAALVPGLMLARIPRGPQTRIDESLPLPAAYRLLKPFFCTDAQLRRAGLLLADGRLPASADLVRRLMAGQTGGVLETALRRLRVHGLDIALAGLGRGAADFPDGRRLLAALFVPVGDADLRHLLPRPVLHNGNEQK